MHSNFFFHCKKSDYSMKEEENIKKDLYSNKYIRMIKRFTEVFDKQLYDFMDLLHENNSSNNEGFLGNLANRLDFNGYYYNKQQQNKR